MVYLATSINESPVITDKAGAAIEDVRGRAVKYNAEGGIVLCAEGETALGIGIMTNDKGIAPGEDVHIQIKDIGLVRAGAAVKKGEEIAPGAEGKFVPAADGDFVCGIALEAAATADVYVKTLLVGYKKGTPAVEVTTEGELAQAIKDAKNGDVIAISGNTNVTNSVKVEEGQEVTINVKKGATLGLDAGASNYGLVVKGDVTIAGEGDTVVTGYGFGTSINTDSKLTIKSGHFIAKGCDYIVGCFDGEVVIEGGEFDGEYCVVNNFSKTYDTDGKVIITGGTFNTSAEESYDVLGDYIEISGGRFSKPVKAEHCASGYEPVATADADGYYTVKAIQI